MEGTWLIAMPVVFVAAFGQGVVGFGFGMVCMATLPLLFDVPFAVPVVSGLGLLVNGSMLVNLRRDVSLGKAAPLLAGGLLGIPLGVGFLRSAPPDLVLLALGAVILAYVAWSFLGGGGGARAGPTWGVIAGFAGGLLGGAFNTGGPPAILYVSGQRWEVGTTKATLQVFFVLTSVVQLSLFALTGMLSLPSLALDALLAPAVFGGVFAGVTLGRRVDRERFRQLMLAVLAVLGVVFVVRAVS